MSNTRQSNSAEDVYTKSYSQFGGVDFQSAVTEIDDKRSPDALNLIADQSGFPQKRPGYTTLATFSGVVYGIHTVTINEVEHMLVHVGTKMYEVNITYDSDGHKQATYVTLCSSMHNNYSQSFLNEGILYILDGDHYLQYDGSAVTSVTGYVPTTQISAPPAGGGEDYEDINLISSKRINLFAGTATAKEYQLDATNITSVDKVEKRNANGTWSAVTAYTVNTATGVVTFTTAPGVSPVTGEDNVRITFSKNTTNRRFIERCTIYTFFGVGSDNRLFLSGNPAYPNRDWRSGSNNCTYFPETAYTLIGTEDSSIMGYMKQFGDLVIIKEDSDQDATTFIRSTSTDSDGKTTFPVIQGLAGTGAIAKRAFDVLYDDNLFLSRQGVFSMDSNKITFQKTTQLRSFYVNSKLTAERDLDNAFSIIWDRFYMLFVNSRVYIADALQRNNNISGSYGYEWYFWDNLPATCAGVYDGDLYIGLSGGKFAVFKDLDSYGMTAYSDDGEAISCYWTTKQDDMGYPTYVKKIRKRNIGVVAMPFPATSGTIYYNVNGDETEVTTYSLSATFDFNNVDFNNFSFGVVQLPTFVPCNKKAKKVKLFQFKVGNSRVNEAFGIYEIKCQYVVKRPVKRYD